MSVFGDTFSGRKVGQGDWRSPVVLIGTGDANHEIVYERAGGDDPNYARQLWHYVHDDDATGWTRGGISTVIPSDLLRVDGSIYLHAIVNRGFGNVIWTEIWRSDDSGISWSHMGEDAKFPADMHDGYAQCWSWDYDPDDGWVYVVATGFQRDKGIILMRVRPEHIGQRSRYVSWGFTDRPLGVGSSRRPRSRRTARSGASCRFAGWHKASGSSADSWRRSTRSGYRVVDSPVANMHTTDSPDTCPGLCVERRESLQERRLRNSMAAMCCRGRDSTSRAASGWWCHSGRPTPDGLTGQCNSRQR